MGPTTTSYRYWIPVFVTMICLCLGAGLTLQQAAYAAEAHPGGSCGGGGSHDDHGGGHDGGAHGGARRGGRGAPRYAGGGGPSRHLEDDVLDGHEDHDHISHEPSAGGAMRPPWAGRGHDATGGGAGHDDGGHDHDDPAEEEEYTIHDTTAPETEYRRGRRGGAITAWTILRDADGAPILDANGHVKPVLVDGRVATLTDTGDLPPNCGAGVQRVSLAPFDAALATTEELGAALDAALARMDGHEPEAPPMPGSERASLSLYTYAMVTERFDRIQAARFLAAAADGPLTVDQLVLVNEFLGLNTVAEEGHVRFADFEYRRSDVFSRSVFDEVFNGRERAVDEGVGAFVLLVNDVRRVLDAATTR